MGKRKRNSAEKIMPESEQIFRGLSFFYVPNSDVGGVRKLRIAKAQNYGARWTRNIADATHVIVDKPLRYADLEPVLGPVKGDDSLTLVSEEYPLDCIQFRRLLNANQFRYQIPGCPKTPSAEKDAVPGPPASSQKSDKSLELKARQTNPSKWDYVPPQGTPSRSEESSHPSQRRSSPQHRSPSESSPGVWLAQDRVVRSLSPVVPRSNDDALEEVEPPQSQEHQYQLEPPSKDELSDLIEIAQQYKDLPLDEEDDQRSAEDDNDAAESGSGSDGEHARKKLKKNRTRSGRKDIAFEERFACYQGGTKDKAAQSANPNASTIEVLQKMLDYYDCVNDNWRILAYRKAIATLRRQPVKITTAAEAELLPGIGSRLSQKIEEIVNTNGLKRLEYAEKEPMNEVLQHFLKIYDVGLSTANKWIAQGHKTLDDLLQKANLTTNQRLGIEHYDDLNSRIPRSEVTALGEYVKKAASRLDPQVELLIGGSYRRGSDSSGDIDFIVTKKGTTSSNDLVPFLQKLLSVLEKDGFIVATLAALNAHRSSREDPGSKWHGCCALPHSPGSSNGSNANQRVWRRIDFLLVPETEYGAALIYFTGNDIFNRSIRLLASKKGMRLNQRGLFKDVMRGPARQKITEGDLVEGRNEKRIFEILGVRWREPSQRWC
ncbi:putative dna polymerase protein [Phaeoacremonium minimum UCRPA7]|uniref:DNA polymerase n=1 Tax=Phaeoacremonium minimum (strain UCR-PA7) TaxID=1286976 RepID=R8BC80_PHAM7|nr:putative dna polymerase protein [Phaeoacremonium minimum UCRPA7]EON96909.1 putative dna polymerase protein [Phaeoacremonium minimum UCRPA7]